MVVGLLGEGLDGARLAHLFFWGGGGAVQSVRLGGCFRRACVCRGVCV